MKKPHIKSNVGFTLVELMVVMAIIAILATAGISAYTNYIEKALITKSNEFARNISTNLVDKLLLKLDLDGSKTDSSGYSNTVTGGGNYVSGVNGNGLNLSGSYLTISANTIFDSSAFTIMAWIKPNILAGGAFAGDNMLFMRETYNVKGFRFGVTYSGLASFWSTQSGGNLSLVATKSMRLAKWNHVAVTYDGTQGSLYLNGKLEKQTNGTYYVPSGNNLLINEHNGVQRDISYDDIRVYSSSLLVGDIQKIYQESAFRYLAQR